MDALTRGWNRCRSTGHSESNTEYDRRTTKTEEQWRLNDGSCHRIQRVFIHGVHAAVHKELKEDKPRGDAVMRGKRDVIS